MSTVITATHPTALMEPNVGEYDRTSGQSWMLWLRPDSTPGGSSGEMGLEATRPLEAVGRCWFALPANGNAFSWCRRGRRAALLYGHLLNREDLTQQLDVPGASDVDAAELLLRAFERWGQNVAERLEGSFAAIVWDAETGDLFCIRDALGAIPLFYSETGSGLVAASDLWTLLRHPDVPHRVNRVVVAEHLLWRHPRLEETFWQGVRRVPGAHALRAHGSEVSVFRYWNPCPADAPIAWLSREEVNRFPEVMDRTVASMMAVGPAAISLSAGIDSASVAAFAASVAAERGWPTPHAMGGYPGGYAGLMDDERAGQEGVARALGLPLTLFSMSECLGGRGVLEAAMAISPTYPAPLGNMWEHNNIHLAEAARRQGLRVVLTGTGGDEWLAVSGHLAADLIRAGDLASLWLLYRSNARSYNLSPLRVAQTTFWHYGLKCVLRDALYRRLPGLAARRRTPGEFPAWLAPDPALRRELRERLQPQAHRAAVDSAYSREINDLLQSWIVTWELEQFYYRVYGRGVTFFHPYWSRPVIDLLLRTPPQLLIEGGRSKGMVRRMLAERFPGLGFERQRKVLHLHSFRRLVAREWPAVWDSFRSGSALAQAGIADVVRLEQTMQEMTASVLRTGFIAQWLSTEAWLRAQTACGFAMT